MPIVLTDPAAELETAGPTAVRVRADTQAPGARRGRGRESRRDTVKRAAAPGRGALRPGAAYASGRRTGRLNRFDQVTE